MDQFCPVGNTERYGLPDQITMDNGSPWGEPDGARAVAYASGCPGGTLCSIIRRLIPLCVCHRQTSACLSSFLPPAQTEDNVSVRLLSQVMLSGPGDGPTLYTILCKCLFSVVAIQAR